jgi:hypothetical protein
MLRYFFKSENFKVLTPIQKGKLPLIKFLIIEYTTKEKNSKYIYCKFLFNKNKIKEADFLPLLPCLLCVKGGKLPVAMPPLPKGAMLSGGERLSPTESKMRPGIEQSEDD